MPMTPLTVTLVLPLEADDIRTRATVARLLALVYTELPGTDVTISGQSVTLRPDPVPQ
jgi:hypothetical protein